MNRLTIEKDERCRICGKPLISEIGTCLQCRNNRAHHFDRVLPLFPYTGNYRTLLTAYKFDKQTSLGNFFIEKIIEGINQLTQLTTANSIDLFPKSSLQNPVLVPVPPRPGKIKQIGWDQIEHLARLLEKAHRRGILSLPVFRCLKRLPSKTQKELNKEARLTNLLSRIRCSKAAPKEVILFDDVYTTGATMDACAATLKSAGAEKVWGICLFYD
jgi:ComF family protein